MINNPGYLGQDGLLHHSRMEQRAGAAGGGDLVPRPAPPAPVLWLQRRPGPILSGGPGGFSAEFFRLGTEPGNKKSDIEGLEKTNCHSIKSLLVLSV
jgi:hypothetical protein